MNDIRPLKDVFDIKGAFPGFWFISLILIALAIAAFIYFKKKKIAEKKSILIQKSPEDIAKDALRLLSEMNLIEKGLIKEYYIRLSDIIRAYIENRHRISAMDRTTWELYQEMRSKKIERIYIDKINDFLEDCDMVKFAKYTPDKKEIEKAYKTAEELIDITTPKPALG